MNFAVDYLNELPLELRVHLIKYLGGVEKYALCEINPGTRTLIQSHDDLSVEWDFAGSSMLSGDTLNDVTKEFKKRVARLNLNHSRWLTHSSLYPSLMRCVNLTHLDVLEANVNGPMLIKILSETSRLRKLGWTVDGDKCVRRANRLYPAKTGFESTGKHDVEKARRNLQRVTSLTLAGYVRRDAAVDSSAVIRNYNFMLDATRINLESLTLVAKDGVSSEIISTAALDILANVDPFQEVIQNCRRRLEKRSDKTHQKLKELNFVWTGDKFGLSEIVLANQFGLLLLPLACYYNQHQDALPKATFAKLTIPSFNGRSFRHFLAAFPHLESKCVFDCSELEELTVVNFSQHNDHWFPHRASATKLIDLEAAPRLRCLRVFCDTFDADDLRAAVLRSPALEKLQIRCSPGVETRSRSVFPRTIVDGIAGVVSACPYLTHLDICQVCAYQPANDADIIPFALFSNLKSSSLRLKAVALSTCLALDHHDVSRSNFQKLVTLSPRLEVLELVDHFYLPSVNLVPNKDHLSNLSQSCRGAEDRLKPTSFDAQFGDVADDLKELTSLTLASIPSPARLNFLTKLAESCPRLERLSLSRVGLTGACEFVSNLSAALPRFRNLKDLRIDHPGFPVGNAQFLLGLRRCVTLERLVVFCQHEKLTKKTSSTFVDTIESLPNLCALQLFSDTPAVLGDQISKRLAAHAKARHPGFHILIARMFGIDSEAIVGKLKLIPFRHWNEMTTLRSRVFPVL